MELFQAVFECGIVIDDYLWFSAWDMNALISCKIPEGIINYVTKFPNESSDMIRLYSSMEYIENYLVFVPAMAERISIFNMETKQFKQIELPSIPNWNKGKEKFFSSICFEKYVYMIGAYNPVIARLDLNTMEIEVFDEWVSGLKKHTHPDIQPVYFRKGVHLFGKKIYIPCSNGNVILVCDVNCQEYTIKKIANSSHKYGDMCFDGDKFWLGPIYGDPIVSWNPASDIIKEYSVYPEGTIALTFLMRYLNNKVWMIPLSSNALISMSNDGSEVKKIDGIGELCYNNTYTFWSAISYKNWLICCEIYEKKIVCINTVDETVNIINLKIEESVIKDYLNREYNIKKENSDVVNELFRFNDSKYSFFTNFMLDISNGISSTLIAKEENCGKKIHDEIMKLL